MRRPHYSPVLLQTLKGYTPKDLSRDVVAGLIVGIIAIPLSIALAIASGASPLQGLLTAAIAGLTAALFGGSRVQISGPTGAFVVIVYGIIGQYGYSGLVTATIMAGILLVAMGLLGLGSLVRYIPRPIVSGFTSGIAIVIFFGQLKDLFGLPISSLPAEFFEKLSVYGKSIASVNPWALAVSAGCLLLLIFLPKLHRKLPAALLAILAATGAAQLFGLPVETIGSLYPDLEGGLPAPSFQLLPLGDYIRLLRPAFTIAVLGAMESLLSAVVADKMIDEKHNSNSELIGQGAANILSGLFGGLPATGAIARTAANVKNGGRTPVAGIVHALLVLLVSLVLLPLAKLIPLSALAAVLVMVCWHMFEWKEIKSISHMPKCDTILMLATMVLTVIFDLVFAIEIGLVLALIFFVRRTSLEARASVSTRYAKEDSAAVYSFCGPLFFGNAAALDDIFHEIKDEKKHLILNMRGVTSLDSSAITALEELLDKCARSGITVTVAQCREQPWKALKKARLTARYKNCCFQRHLQQTAPAIPLTENV